MDTEERILNDPQCAPYVDQQRKWVNEAFMAGVNWAQQNGTIPWQTGDPKEDGSYLVTVKGTYDTFVTCAYYSHLRGWSHWNNVLSWHKLNDIKPFKEELLKSL